MKKIGILGGVAWPSTVDYYAGICRLVEEHFLAKERSGLAQMPEMAIESLDLKRVLSSIGTDGDERSWQAFDAYHRNALVRLEASGADFAVMASNSPHHRYEAITRGVTIPVLNMFDLVAQRCAALAPGSIYIFGTALTMRSAVLLEAFAKQGVIARAPTNEIRSKTITLLGDIHSGNSAGAKERFERLISRSIDSLSGPKPIVCLACTELPLLFPDEKRAEVFENNGFTYLNTMAVHINAAFRATLGTGPIDA